jgi:hypothetical protein
MRKYSICSFSFPGMYDGTRGFLLYIPVFLCTFGFVEASIELTVRMVDALGKSVPCDLYYSWMGHYALINHLYYALITNLYYIYQVSSRQQWGRVCT